MRFEHISLEQGLSESAVSSIIEDRLGFIWVGTADGLNRYDGYGFTIYRPNKEDARSISGSSISTIYQDRDGAIWVAPRSGGLSRFNPGTQRFQTYRNNPNDKNSLSYDTVLAIYQDRAGNIWAGTEGGGLNRLDLQTQTFTVYQHTTGSPGISSNYIKTIYQDRLGSIWIGTDRGLNEFDPNTQIFKLHRHDPDNAKSLSDNMVTAICEDDAGNLWVGTSNGLNKYQRETDSFTVYRNSPAKLKSISNNSILTIKRDRNGQLWIGTDKGLNRYQRETDSFTSYLTDLKNPTSLSNDNVRDICQDRAGNLWLATRAGINKFDVNSKPFHTYRNNPLNPLSLSAKEADTIYEDRAGTLWVIGGDRVLNRYDPANDGFVKYRHDANDPNSISDSEVMSIYQDSAGDLWIGTNKGGLNKYDRRTDSFKIYRYDARNPNSIAGNSIATIFEDRSGRLWISSDRGLSRYNRERDNFITYLANSQTLTEIASGTIRIIQDDSAGNLWLGNVNGLIKYNPVSQKITQFRYQANNPQTIRSNYIFLIHEDARARIWISTIGGGLSRYNADSETFTSYLNEPNNPQSLSNNTIFVIHEDAQGILWLGTEGGGLNRFDPETGIFTSFQEQHGLANNTIYAILSDQESNLWFSTNRGLVKFNPSNNRIRNYDKEDGLQDSEFNGGSACKLRNGELLFGGINGLNRFQPAQISDNTFLPELVITAIKLSKDQQEKAQSILAQIYQQIYNGQQPSIELSLAENIFSFEFAALNFTQAQKNQYAYILEGFNKDWVTGDSRRLAPYTNLNPGDYVLRIKGSNNDGLWNESGLSIHIRVLPPFWLTWWAYGFYLCCFIGIGYGLVQASSLVLKRRNTILEGLVKTRTNQLDEKVAELQDAKQEVENRIEELTRKNMELVESYKRTEVVFSALSEILPGTIIADKYRLDKSIGAGGFGVVYKATQLVLNREVAIKILRPTASGFDMNNLSSLDRFHLEAISTCRINHINAISVLDFGITPTGIAYLVMELLKGHTLADELKEHQRLSLTRCAEILYPTCQALAAAHNVGIIHRDIKPENIFLHQSKDGEIIKVLDFGIAKLLNNTGSVNMASLTVTGNLIGTPTYMAPERFDNSPLTGQSDVYSVATMLYQMLAGQPPFHSPDNDLWAIALMQKTKEPPLLTSINPEISTAIETIIMRALAKQPEQRPAAMELANQFAQAVGWQEQGINHEEHEEHEVKNFKSRLPQSTQTTLGN